MDSSYLSASVWRSMGATHETEKQQIPPPRVPFDFCSLSIRDQMNGKLLLLLPFALLLLPATAFAGETSDVLSASKTLNITIISSSILL